MFSAGEQISLARTIMVRTEQELRCTALDIMDELRSFPDGPEPDRALRDASKRLLAIAAVQEQLMDDSGGDVVLHDTVVGLCRALAQCSRSPTCGDVIVRSTKATIDRHAARHVLAVLLPLLAGAHGWSIVGTDRGVTVDLVRDGDDVLIRIWDVGATPPDRERLGGTDLLEAVWASGGRFVHQDEFSTDPAEGVCTAVRVPLPIAGFAVSGNA